MINQGVARAFARVRRPGVLTFAAVSEVGVSGRRVDGGHSLNSFSLPTSTPYNCNRKVGGTNPKRQTNPKQCLTARLSVTCSEMDFASQCDGFPSHCGGTSVTL